MFYNPESYRYECDQCDRTYQRRTSLYTHKKFECGKEPLFPCGYCEYRTTRKGTLKRHLKYRHRYIKF